MNNFTRKRRAFERRLIYLDGFIVAVWSLFALVVLGSIVFFWFDLGRTPPESRIDNQTHSEQEQEIANSNFGRSRPVQPNSPPHPNNGSNGYETTETGNETLDHLREIRDLHAQEGVWRVGR